VGDFEDAVYCWRTQARSWLDANAGVVLSAGAGAIGGSALYWAGDVVCLWAALHSVGEPLPVSELALAYATGYAAMILPLPFGGVGGVDAAMTYALTAVGVPLAPALVAVAAAPHDPSTDASPDSPTRND